MTTGLVVLAQATADGNAFAQMLVDGISFGAIYALLAMGFVIIFKATSVINFAHGALTGLGAFLVVAFATVLDFPGRYLPTGLPEWAQWTANVLTAFVVAALFGVLIERVFLRPMVGEALFAVAIVTLGIDIVVRTITNDFIGTQPRPVGAPWGLNVIDLGWVIIAWSEVIQIVVTILLLVAIALFLRTRTGVAMRATAFDQGTAGPGRERRTGVLGGLGDRGISGRSGRVVLLRVPASGHRSGSGNGVHRLSRLSSGDHRWS